MAPFDGLLREALLVAALLCLPILCVATAAGTVVAILQAATQVQEQTLSLLPKILAVGVAVALFGQTAMHLCARLFTDTVAQIPLLVSQ